MLYLDIETRSALNIRRVGLHRYAEHSSTRIIMIQWAIDDGIVQVCEPLTEQLPADLLTALKNKTIVAHNSMFERKLLRHVMGIDIPAERFIDTMVQALAHGFPASLKALSETLGLDDAKLDSGTRLIRIFSNPINFEGEEFYDKTSHPTEWQEFREYGIYDVLATREAYKKLPKMNYPKLEHGLWELDQEMADRGIPLDMDLIEGAIEEAEKERERLNLETQTLTGGEVGASTQRDALLSFIAKTYDEYLPDLKKGTLESILTRNDLPTAMRELIIVRLLSSQNASAKYKKMKDLAVKDEEGTWRIKGSIQMYGASRTGRDSARGAQFQNLKRPVLWRDVPDDALEERIERDVQAIKEGTIGELYPKEVAEILGDCVRGVIAPSSGRYLVQSDLSNIEGRVLVWLSGEDWKVNFFKDYDSGKVKYDNYVTAYAKAMGTPPADVTGYQRAIGKVMELACGYGGGASAYASFADIYGLDIMEMYDALVESVGKNGLADARNKYEWMKEQGFTADLTEDEFTACEYLKTKWRESHPATVNFWASLEDAFRRCIMVKNKPMRVGRLTFVGAGNAVYVKLPSGRVLVYPESRIEEDGMTFLGLDRGSMRRRHIYSGILAENVSSGTARDVLFSSIPTAEKKGFEIVCRVHDEFITEVKEDSFLTHKELEEIMATNPPWADGLPLAAEGYTTTKRYRK